MKLSHHMSIGVEYSVDPSNTSGGRYQSVTTSLEYVLVGTDLARAKPAQKEFIIMVMKHLFKKNIWMDGYIHSTKI